MIDENEFFITYLKARGTQKAQIKNLPPLEAPPGYEYKNINGILPGNQIYRWGDDLEILKIEKTRKGTVSVSAMDHTDGGEEVVMTWEYSQEAELLVKNVE